eukprot:scaffold61399_cov74-Phaeocystis_antarctica.AAC.2
MPGTSPSTTEIVQTCCRENHTARRHGAAAGLVRSARADAYRAEALLCERAHLSALCARAPSLL